MENHEDSKLREIKQNQDRKSSELKKVEAEITTLLTRQKTEMQNMEEKKSKIEGEISELANRYAERAADIARELQRN